MPFGNPLISLDNRANEVSKEDALKLAGKAMETAYSTFLMNDKYVNGSDSSNRALAEIRQKIDKLEYKDEIAGYWILEGPYELLVDKSTGALFFKYGIKGIKISGSYSEGISPVDVNDKDIFARGYF
ncbi:copper amine oxidase-like domain-containing protein [Schinkia azotoformans LMG 9581]|uniref:Copper amine oxidase-like domain-containing protein n=1 Tax=Schinkia azotoformans LMG 9581 TaxID=1131731 RepID=K6ECI5_SCHAZ|nr:copper amine oxidase-like domain-containing protein [Schinkia azotoformans LMG 9581]